MSPLTIIIFAIRSPSNGVISNMVLLDLDLSFHDKQLEMLIIIEQFLSLVFYFMCTESKNLLAVIKKLLPEIVREVEVRGHILDKMISYDIISFALRQEIDIIPTKEDRARNILERILTSSDWRPSSCFLEALKRDYKFLADKIRAELKEISSEGKDDMGSSLLLAYHYVTMPLLGSLY